MSKSATTEKPPETQTVTGDPAVIDTRRSLADLRARLAEVQALAATPFGVTRVQTRQQREATEESLRLQEVIPAAARNAAAAEASARERIVAARKPERLALLRRLLDAAGLARDAALAVQAYDRATAEALGDIPELHPMPQLLGLGDALDRLRREISGPPRVIGPAPVPAGKVRLRLLASLHDPSAMMYRMPGDVADFDDEVARDLLKRGIAEGVA
jgi:hypothetical protein